MNPRKTVEFDLLDPEFLRPSFRVIEAGAGSGKTYNLEFQVLRLVAELGKRIDEIVLVTFTEAAAIEMRQRVRERLEGAVGRFRGLSQKDRLSAKDAAELAALRTILGATGDGAEASPSPERNKRIMEAVARMSRLRVTTIHGFCQSMLGEHGPNTGFAPLVSAPVDGADLAEEIASDWCRRYPGLTSLGESIMAAKALISDPDCDISLLFREQAYPKAIAIAGVAPRRYKNKPESKVQYREWQVNFNGNLAELTKPDAVKFADFVKNWRTLSQVVTFDDLVLRLRDSIRETGGSHGDVAALRALLRKELPAPSEDDEGLVDGLADVLGVDGEKASRLQTKLLELIGGEHDGEIVNAVGRALLGRSERASALVAAIRGQFTCCLIDEFQDTDDSQWAIFGDLFRPRRIDPGSAHQLLVVVGDPKQAIYGFRGADISAYNRAVLMASDRGKVHVLKKNHRSSENVIRAFNQIFRRERYFGESLIYEEAVPVKPLDVSVARPIEIVGSNDVEDIPAEVARLLRELDALDQSQDGTKAPPGEQRTVGVLVRGNADADAIHRALVERRLPAALESTQSVFATQAAYLAQLLLQAVLESDDLRPRRALIYARPSLFGDLKQALEGPDAEKALQVFDDELAEWLAKCHRRWTKHGFPSMWSRLTRVSPSEGRKATPSIPVLQSVQQSLAGAEFRSRLLVDLAHVGELLAARQRENLWDPHQVMEHLRLKIAGSESDGDVEDAGASLDEALRPETERPRVLVQTIHKSKGLQYDGVVLYLKPSTREGRTSGMVLRPTDDACSSLGVPRGKRLILGGGDFYSKTGLEELIETQKREEDARLLYVAITRAKHRIVVMTAPPESQDEKNPPARESNTPDAVAPDEVKPGCVDVDSKRFKGFQKVLAHACVHPFLWVPFRKVDDWDGAFVGNLEPAAFEYDAKRDLVRGPELAPGPNCPLPRIRGTTSFSVLTRAPHARSDDGKGPDEGNDHRRNPPRPDSDLLLDGRVKGALFGTFVHELLDGLDFEKASNGRHPDGTLVEHVHARLRTSGLPPLEGDPEHMKLAEQVCGSCKKWLSAKLPLIKDAEASRFTLAEIDHKKTLSEVRFALRADLREGNVARIKELFAQEYERYGDDSPLKAVSLSGESVKGLLTGVADLIFEHDNRYYILDWKTNYLGDMVMHYDRKAVDAEVAESQYHLQYALYTVALDAYLAQALGKEWSYDRADVGSGSNKKSFGGVYYLFLRAFGAQKEDVLGCHYHRPRHIFIENLRKAINQPLLTSNETHA